MSGGQSGIAFHSRSSSPSYNDSSSSQSQTQSSGSHRSSTKTDDDSCDENKACYWPVFAFIILFIIIVIVWFCSGWGSGDSCSNSWGGFGTTGAVGFALLFFIIWIIVLWFFCRSGQMVGAWFFLLLIFALVFVWWIASVLANLGCC